MNLDIASHQRMLAYSENLQSFEGPLNILFGFLDLHDFNRFSRDYAKALAENLILWNFNSIVNLVVFFHIEGWGQDLTKGLVPALVLLFFEKHEIFLKSVGKDQFKRK